MCSSVSLDFTNISITINFVDNTFILFIRILALFRAAFFMFSHFSRSWSGFLGQLDISNGVKIVCNFNRSFFELVISRIGSLTELHWIANDNFHKLHNIFLVLRCAFFVKIRTTQQMLVLIMKRIIYI